MFERLVRNNCTELVPAVFLSKIFKSRLFIHRILMCSIGKRDLNFSWCDCTRYQIKFWSYVWIVCCAFSSFNECFAAVSNILVDFSTMTVISPFCSKFESSELMT